MNTLLAPDLKLLSRREFLTGMKTGGLALFLLFLQQHSQGRERLIPAAAFRRLGMLGSLPAAEGSPASTDDTPVLGRVLDNDLRVYDRPSFSGKLLNIYWRDLVYPINAATIGDKLPEHNRVWYQINNEGYVHSGMVQPVELNLNEPLTSLPKGGRLTEVSVPYTDARRDINRTNWPSYRLYYGTTHWVRALVQDKSGGWWYRITDDKFRKTYFVDARHLRPLDDSRQSPLATYAGIDKRLEVRLGEQVVVAYEDGQPVFMTRMASGAHFLAGNYTTPTGQYVTNRKRPSRHMAAGDLAASGYDLPGVPWVTYLTLSGISFHGTYWHNDFGKPRSHGCLNVNINAANWIYRWSTPGVPLGEETYTGKEGTLVDIVE